MRRAPWLCLAGLLVVGIAMTGCTAVTKGTISGLIYEAGSDPHLGVQGVLVTAREGGAEVASMTTLADGKYRLSDLSPGNYALTVEKTGYTTKEFTVQVDFGDNLAGSVKRDVPLAKVRGTISGQVKGLVGATQLDLNGATVTLAGPTTGVVQTADGGNYAFANVDDGNYQITVAMSGFQTSAPRDVVILNGVSANDIDFVLTQ